MGSRERSRPICSLCRAQLRVVFVWARASFLLSSRARPPPSPVPRLTAAAAPAPERGSPAWPGPLCASACSPSVGRRLGSRENAWVLPECLSFHVSKDEVYERRCHLREGGKRVDSSSQLVGTVWKHVGPAEIRSLALFGFIRPRSEPFVPVH